MSHYDYTSLRFIRRSSITALCLLALIALSMAQGDDSGLPTRTSTFSAFTAPGRPS